jgi:thiamine monophosphate kinase
MSESDYLETRLHVPEDWSPSHHNAAWKTLSQKYSDKLAAIQQSVCTLQHITLGLTDLLKNNYKN